MSDQPAATLMRNSGSILANTGLALNTASVLYFAKYMTELGTGLLEFMPVMMAGRWSTSREFMALLTTHFQDRHLSTVWSYVGLGGCLLIGILMRALGEWVKRDETIAAVERILYRKK